MLKAPYPMAYSCVLSQVIHFNLEGGRHRSLWRDRRPRKGSADAPSLGRGRRGWAMAGER